MLRPAIERQVRLLIKMTAVMPFMDERDQSVAKSLALDFAKNETLSILQLKYLELITHRALKKQETDDA